MSEFDLFPVKPWNKEPFVSQKLATSDSKVHAEWWQQWPDASVGCRPHPDELLLDVDPRHGGLETWVALEDEFGAIPVGRLHYWVGGMAGFTAWFKRPEGLTRVTIKRLHEWAHEHKVGSVTDKGKWICGIDLLHHDWRYTILPPSKHPATGQPYQWRYPVGEPQLLPDFLVELLTPMQGQPDDDEEQPEQPESPPRPPSTPSVFDAYKQDSIADWFGETMTWGQILQPHSWPLVHGDGDSDGSLWRHPTATAEHSASIQYGCLFVYSPNTIFEETEEGDPRGYTRFRAWAVLNHGGDLSAAARAAQALKDALVPLAVDGHSAFVRASDVKSELQRWAWRGRLPLGELTIVGGREKLGKSTAIVWASARVTRGELPGDLEGIPRDVLYVSGEDHYRRVLKPRLALAGADLDRVHLLDPEGPGFSVEAVRVLPEGPALIALDPLSLFVEIDAAHEHGEMATRKGLHPLVRLAEDLEAAVVGIRHLRKSGGASNPYDALMGSRAYSAAARSVIFFTPDPRDKTRLGGLMFARGNLAAPSPAHAFDLAIHDVTLDDGNTVQEPLFVPSALPEQIELEDALGNDGEQTSELERAVEWLGDVLKGGSQKAVDVKRLAREDDISPITLRRARERLGVVSERVGGIGAQGHWEWSDPKVINPAGEGSREDGDQLSFGDTSPQVSDDSRAPATPALVPKVLREKREHLREPLSAADVDGARRMAEARRAAGVPLSDADRAALGEENDR